MNYNKPWLIIISGPNGAGKTTFYNKIIEQNPVFKNALFANSDIEFSELMSLPENVKIVRKMKYALTQQNEDFHRTTLTQFETRMQIRAAEITLNKTYRAFLNGENVILETTGAGNTAIRFAQKAQQTYHYNVYSFHLYLSHPETSITRVDQRVKNGGHNVPTDVIFQRYTKSLYSLPRVLSAVNRGLVMDNSDKKPFMPVFAQLDGYIVNLSACPDYLQPARQQMIGKFPQKSVKESLGLQQDIDTTKMLTEQRDIFVQAVISRMFEQIR